MGTCVSKFDYKEASKYLLLARAYGDFDAMRVQDETARNAPVNLERIFFNEMSIRELESLQKAVDILASETAREQEYCELQRQLGFPVYYPRYMLDYGIKPVQGSGLVDGFDSKTIWGDILTSCLSIRPANVYPNPEAVGRRDALSFTESMSASGDIKGLAWSPDEKKIAIHAWIHSHPTIQVFNRGDFFSTVLSDVNGIPPISYDPNGLYLAAGTYKFVGQNLLDSVVIRDAKSNKVLRNLSLPEKYLANFEADKGRYQLRVTSITFDLMSTKLIASFYASSFQSSLREKYICEFSLLDGSVSSVLKIKHMLSNINYSADGENLWGTVNLMTLRNVWGMKIKPEDWDATTRQVFKRTWNYSIEGINLKTKVESKLVENIHTPLIQAVAFNSRFNLIATASSYGLEQTTAITENIGRAVKNRDPVRIWDLNGHLLHEVPAEYVRSLDFSPDGSLLATCSTTKLSLWDTKTGYLIQQHAFGGMSLNRPIPYCVFSPKGNSLAVGAGNSIDIYDISGTEVKDDDL